MFFILFLRLLFVLFRFVFFCICVCACVLLRLFWSSRSGDVWLLGCWLGLGLGFGELGLFGFLCFWGDLLLFIAIYCLPYKNAVGLIALLLLHIDLGLLRHHAPIHRVIHARVHHHHHILPTIHGRANLTLHKCLPPIILPLIGPILMPSSPIPLTLPQFPNTILNIIIQRLTGIQNFVPIIFIVLVDEVFQEIFVAGVFLF